MSLTDDLDRTQIPDTHKWNPRHLYRSDAAWEKQRASLLASLPDLAAFSGKLGQGEQQVLACLTQYFGARKTLARLTCYAHRLHDQDTRVPRYQGYKAVMEQAAVQLSEATAFLLPELLALPEETLQGMAEDPAFTEYDQFMRDLLRQRPHILSPTEEALLAATGQMCDTGYTAFSTFTSADLEYPEIEDEKGKRVRLTQALFARYRASTDRAVRKRAFSAFFSNFAKYQNTLASLLGAQVNANITHARVRRFGSALEAALYQSHIPEAVYHNMLAAVDSYLPLLHRYLRLRRRRLGLRQLHYHDLYPPIVQEVELRFSYEDARRLIAGAMAPMGKEYVKALSAGMDPRKGWVDPFPNRGKRSGAYMDGFAYDVHPYVLSNFIGTYGSVSTMAHEMGHALHSLLSNRRQPYPKSDYSIFVAEVASTFNESLLMAHMLRTVTDPQQRLYLLGEQLESFRQTLFRQTLFAEFELRLYQVAERKEAITAEVVNQLYLEVVRRYYGHDEKLVLVDESNALEWAYVPHFYYNFYVFQYVTGMTAATALAEMVLQEGAPARQRYLDHLLSAGCSDYPITLLQRAGVDLTGTQPYDLAMEVFRRTLEETEALARR